MKILLDVPSYELFSKGLLRTFQIAHEFTNLTVLGKFNDGSWQSIRRKSLMNALLKPKL